MDGDDKVHLTVCMMMLYLFDPSQPIFLSVGWSKKKKQFEKRNPVISLFYKKQV